MTKPSPPNWVFSVIRFAFKDTYVEQIEGDLLELYSREESAGKAKRSFLWNSLRFLRLRYLKGLDDYEQLTTLAMIKNYFKVALRTLIKQRSFAAINIIGLSIGLAACLLITLYVLNERSYDQFYPDSERIYRVANGERGRWTPELLAETMMKEYPQVEVATKVSGLWPSVIQFEDRVFTQEGTAYGDNQFFEVFQMPFVSGNAREALRDPNTVVLTASTARKFFPNEPAIGQQFKIDGENVKVTAIVKDPPKNTHFPFQLVIANPTDYDMEHYWTGNNYWTYAKIQKGVSAETMDQQLLDLYRRYVGTEILADGDYDSWEEFLQSNPNRYYGYTLHPMTGIHLENPHLSMGPRGNKRNVTVFSIIAAFILLIACVNYINMSTARSALRSKEVGIRKAMGSYRKQLILQFIVESVLVTFLAIVIALILAGGVLPYFNQLTNRLFAFDDLWSFQTVLTMLALLVLVGLLAGAYPAYVISGYSPIQALRGFIKTAGKNRIRTGLVIFQFAISIFLIAVTLFVYRQVKYMQSQDLGVEISQTFVIKNGAQLEQKYQVFEQQLKQLPQVRSVAKASHVPFYRSSNYTYLLPDKENQRLSVNTGFISPDFEKALDLQLVDGRFFSKDLASDTSRIIINEALASELGWRNPIGKQLLRPGPTDQALALEVIGIMKDFHYSSLREQIEPLVFRYGQNSGEAADYHQNYVLVSLNTTDIIKTVGQIETFWDQHSPDYPFEADFLSDVYQLHYESERRFGQIFTTFSILAVFIALLGLFALNTFILQKRLKEIAVRKVLGATVPSLLHMILRDFTKLVALGGVVGASVAFYWLQDWFEDYSYRIDISWIWLAIPVLMILLLTWVMVCVRSYRAAVANPAHALKEE